MIIAIYDNDFKMTKASCFNINLMKLSSYYKSKNNIVILITNFHNEHLYDKIIYSADFNEPYFEFMKNYDKIEFMGKYFYETFVPLPIEIEKQPNDVTLYENFFYKNLKLFNEVTTRKINHQLKFGFHIRLAPDGKNITDNYLNDVKDMSPSNCIIHDQNFFDLDGYDLMLKKIINKNMSFSFRYEQKITDIERLFVLKNYNLSKYYNHFYIPSISNKDFIRVCNVFQYRKTVIRLEALQRYEENVHMMSNELQNLIKRIIFCKGNKSFFVLNNTRKIFDKDLEAFIKLLIKWHNSENNSCFIDYCNSYPLIRKQCRELKISRLINKYNLTSLVNTSIDNFKEILT